MKKICLLLISFLFTTQVFASTYNKMIFFGDSLTDNGNLYALVLHVVPKSPPYYKGRFSNGPTWAEGVGKYFYDKYFIDSKIYAVGGATAQFRLPTDKFFPPTNLDLQINNYLFDTAFKDKSKVLYTVWIGGNDYLYYGNTDNADVLTDKVVNSITAGIKKLISNGGKYFLILNLPDPSKTPFAKANGTADRVKFLTEKHNKKLAANIETLKAMHPQVQFVYLDTFAIFNDVVQNTDKYNTKYGVNITNITDACWEGKYYFKTDIAAYNLKKELSQATRIEARSVDTEKLAQTILTNPTLLSTYKVGAGADEGSLSPCANPDQYLFWDTIHPSAVVHDILAKLVIDALTTNALIPA